MARLPTIGSDAGNWGTILNEFLQISHNADGTLKGLSNFINVKDFGAKGDGTTNDTAAIQAALDAVTSSGTVVFPPGIYLVDGVLLHNNKINVLGFGNATLQASSSMIRVVSTNGFHDCIIDGLIGIGTGADTGSSSGRGIFHIAQGSLRCIVQNCKALNSSGSGIVDDGEESKVLNNHIEVSGEHGIYLSSSKYAVIQGNLIKSSGTISVLSPILYSGIKIDGASYCSIIGNQIIESKTQGLTLTGPCFKNSIIGNIIKDSTENDIYIATGNDNVFSNNVIDSSSSAYDAVLTTGGTRNIISGNYIRKTTAQSAIRWNTVDALGWDICSNNLIVFDGSFTSPAAIWVDSTVAEFIQIRNNLIQKINGAGISHGILLDGALDTSVFGNISQASSRFTDNGTRTLCDSSILDLNIGSQPTIFSGSGSPEGVFAAKPGSIYVNTNGGAGTSIYVKETGTGSTGWIAK